MEPVLRHAKRISRKLTVYDSSLETLIQQVAESRQKQQLDDAFFVCDVGEVVNRHRRFQAELPRVKPYYAVKCNEDEVILKTVDNVFGIGFEVASKTELEKVLAMNMPPSHIIYANPCKKMADIRLAARHGVARMTFDSESELEKISQVYPDAKLILRIQPEDFEVAFPMANKFGCHQPDVPRLLAKAQQLQLDVIGVCFHVGYGGRDVKAFPTAISLARKAFNQAVAFGFKPYVLDIGGGFPGYDAFQTSFEQICAELRPALDEHFPVSSGVEIIAEPGRFYVTSAYTVAANVIGRRLMPADEPSDQQFMYYLNDGLYGSFLALKCDPVMTMFINPKLLSKDENSDQKPLYVSTVWGPTCNSLDRLLDKQRLPEWQVGDWVIFRDMGAYSLTHRSVFNGTTELHVEYVVHADNLHYFNNGLKLGHHSS